MVAGTTALIIICSQNWEDTLPTYHLREERVSARYQEFKNSIDMYSTIYIGQMYSFPILFDDTKYVMMSIGGIAPVFYGLSIRGGNPMENGVFINGIPLFNSPLRFLTLLPVDRDAVSTIRVHRGNMPGDYEGFLSAVVEIETNPHIRYVKSGIPSANFSISGLYGDYFWPGPFMGENFQWTNAFFLWNKSSISALFSWGCQTYRNITGFYDFVGNDTLFKWQECITTAGVSYREHPFHIHYTLEIKEHYDTSNVFKEPGIGQSIKHHFGIRFSMAGWGAGFQYHEYDFSGNYEEPPESINILINRFAMVWIFYRLPAGEIGLEYYSQNKILPLIRLRHKYFIDSTRALSLFLGTSSQGYISFGFPIFERIIVRNRVNFGYTAVAGYEHIFPGFSLQINGFARYFHPYYVLNPLLFPSYISPDSSVSLSPEEYFIDRSTLSAGMDITLHEYRKGPMTVSVTILRSFFTDTWTPSPEDIIYVFNFNYKYLNVMWMAGPIRYEQVLNPKRRTYRESSMYIYSIAIPFRWKGFDFRIGVYNIFPQPNPDDEFSAIYRAFPIPILSVKKEF